MNIKNLYIAFLAVIIIFLFRDTFHVFSANAAVGILVIIGFIALAFYLIKFKLPEIKKANDEEKAKKKAQKEIRDLVSNKTANEEIE
ncbi:hypothetical protein ACXM5X_31650 [Pseudomonas saponiphila]|jgi:Na+/melibiose symporter-like transporter